MARIALFHRRFLVIGFLAVSGLCHAAPEGFSALLLSDDFEREEPDPANEMVGNEWGTNSRTRAKGEKQADLRNGAMHVARAAVADHGVSVFHEVAFTDAVIQLRFQLGEKDDLGVNIADLEEESVHAGHICMAKVRLRNVELVDLKTGRMKREHRDARQAKAETKEMKKLIATKSKLVPVDLSPGEWHDLEVRIEGDTMTVRIDGGEIGRFSSPGIAHPTERRLRLAVGKEAVIDDVRVWGRSSGR